MVTTHLTINRLRTTGVNVPMVRPLQTSGGSVSSAPFVLVDLETSQGITGHAYIFCYATRFIAPLRALLESLNEVISGSPVAPLALEEKLQAVFRLAGPVGVSGWAMAGIDMAAWDSLAKEAGKPLASLLGGEVRPIPAYDSRGLGIAPQQTPLAKIPRLIADQAGELAKDGLAGIKVRLGYPAANMDLEVVQAVRSALPPDMPLMCDYNQSLSIPEARQRMALLRDTGLTWIEEPTRWDDYAGHARIRDNAPLNIQLGENCWGANDMEKAMSAGAMDFFMPDLGKIGGVTGWTRAMGLATPAGLPLSSHLFPEVSAHLLAVTPTRHWLEYVDWAEPILAEGMKFQDGHALPSTLPGSGITWNEQAIAKYTMA